MSILKNILVGLSGNRRIQNLLEWNVLVAHYLMGIGSGGDVLSSGEDGIFQLVRKHGDTPLCIFDVGANKGQFLEMLLRNLPTETLSVHCFEPNHEAFTALAQKAGGDARIHLNQFGLAREKGQAVLHFDKAGSGLASLSKRRLDHFGIQFDQSEIITTRTIDDYCDEHGISHIHLLKIDIEGHELDALAGAEKMLGRKAIDTVTFEFGGCNIDTRTFFQDFWYFFNSLGMKIYRVTPSGYLHEVVSYREVHEQFRTINFVATYQSA